MSDARYTIQVPDSKYPPNSPFGEANKFVRNLTSMVSEKLKEQKVPDGLLNYGELLESIKKSESTGVLILNETDYKKVMAIANNCNGWPDYEAQKELWNALEAATKELAP